MHVFFGTKMTALTFSNRETATQPLPLPLWYQNDRADLLYPTVPLPPCHCHSPRHCHRHCHCLSILHDPKIPNFPSNFQPATTNSILPLPLPLWYQNDRADLLYPPVPLPPCHCHSPCHCRPTQHLARFDVSSDARSAVFGAQDGSFSVFSLPNALKTAADLRGNFPVLRDLSRPHGPDAVFFAENDAKMTENEAKMTENGAKLTENGAKLTEIGAKTAENGPKLTKRGAQVAKAGESAPESTEIAENAEKSAENAEKAAENAEKAAEIDSKSAENTENRAQNAPNSPESGEIGPIRAVAVGPAGRFIVAAAENDAVLVFRATD
jgi:hypothetical protein